MVMMENVFMVHLLVVLMRVFIIQLDQLKVCLIFVERNTYSIIFIGWRPSEFKSSRTERAEKRSYEPEDYMDKGVRIIRKFK